jgi:hypothetical protein
MFNCLANTDAASPDEQTVMIDYSVFNVTLEDHLGQERLLVQDIDVIVSSPPRYGQFNNRVRGAISITTFKLVELEQGEIEYQFANQITITENDSFSWTFQYGNSSVGPFHLQICFGPIPEISVHVGVALVEFGEVVYLDSSHLLARDECGGMNDSLVYHIVIPPQHGSLMNQLTMNTTLMNFTQTDLNNHQILYQSRHYTTMQDEFIFIVCDAYRRRCSEAEIFVIKIYHYNIMVVNTGFEVEEGSVHYITVDELYIHAPKDSIGLRFIVEQYPEHGNISLKTGNRVIVDVQFFDLANVTSGSILYQNNGREFLHDSFQFTAIAQYFNEVTGNYETLDFSDMVNITILPVNDHPPEIIRPLLTYDAVKGGSTIIHGSLLNAHDRDSDMRDEDIVWQLQLNSPYNGYMYLDVNRGMEHAISNWTEGDLRKDRLYYRNDRGGPSSNIDIILYTISDGFHTSEEKRIFLHLQEIIFESNATADPPLHVTEGESVRITTEYLSYRALNDNSLGDDDFLYTLQTLPRHGSLMFNGAVLQTEVSFNQQSLRSGSLVYIHDDSNSIIDSFQYKLEVIGRAEKFYEFQIDINSVDDDPPEVTYIQDPLFVAELSQVQINGSALVIFDLDADNPVEFDEIVCTVVRQPRYGLLPRDRFGKRTIHTNEFTKLDIERNHIFYSHTSLGHYEDSFTFKVTDGINPQNETYEVRIIVLPKEISIGLNSIFSVVKNQQVFFKSEDFIIDHPFLSTVPGQFILIRQPSNGIILNVVTNERINNGFTTGDLANESIVYNQNVRNAFNDSFEFFYESLLLEGLRRRSVPKTVFVHIITDIITTNTGFAVEEGHGHNITTQELNIYTSNKLITINAQFHITGPPNHGRILVNDNNVTIFNLSDLTSGMIHYHHNGEESLQDHFKFSAVGSYCNVQCYQLQIADTINITVIPVNDNAPQFIRHSSSLNAVELGSTPITTSLFRAHYPDSDQRDENIIWVLEYTSPYNGYMYLDRDPGNRDLGITRWTEGDLRAGRLYYRHDEAGKQSDIVLYRVRDSYHSSDTERTFINLFPRFMSKATASESFRVTEGYNATITTKYLNYYASNNESLEDEQFSYTLQSQPRHGSLVLSGGFLEQGARFTQEDLLNGLLIYVHDDSNDILDSFHYNLSVIGFVDMFRESYEFQILIDPVDDDPPEVTIIQDPLYVDELNIVEINDSVLVIYDFDSNGNIDSYKNISCIIGKAPRYGLLQRNGMFSDSTSTFMFTKYNVIQNQLWYNHTSIGHYEDSFTFTISDGVNLQQETYNVSIVILPDIIPIEVSSIDVREGQQTNLNRENFVINHAYLSRVSGHFVITQAPKTGTLRNTFTNRNELSEFTVEDLSSNSIVYLHSGDDSDNDTFSFIYKTDEPVRQSLEVTMFVHIHEVNLTIINTGFAVQEGQKHNITTQELNVYIPAKSRNFCFNITRLPEHGNLSVDTIKSTERGERHFVLDNLDTGHIFYRRDDRKSLSDSFEFTATALYFNESNHTIEEFQMTHSLNFTILPINDVTTQELNIPFPVNSTNISINITSPPQYGDIIVSIISQTAVEFDIHLNNLAIEQIFYRLNNDTCEQESFIFQARIQYFDAESQTLNVIDRTFNLTISNFSSTFQELSLSLPPNPRALHLVNLIKKPICGDIVVSTIKVIDKEQQFIQIEDLATTRIFYQKKLHDNFKFTAVADYFNETSRIWEIFQMTDSSFNVAILPYPRTTQEIGIPFPANSNNIRISILKPPMYGNVIISTNKVLGGDLEQCLFLKNTIAEHIFYQNNDGENLHDSFGFTALTEYFSAESQSWEQFQITESVNITINLLNDNPPEFVRRAQEFYAVQGGSTPLTSLLFSASDADRDEDIVWQLRESTPFQGYIYLDVDPGRRDLGVTNWTEGDLRAGRLYYRDYSSESSNAMIYVITDGVHVSKERYTQIVLFPILFESKAIANISLNITKEDNITITTDYLSYCASNDNSLRDKDFIYTLHSLPMQGSLVLNGRILKNGSSFNQQDLHNGSLIYVYDYGTNVEEVDSFQYSLSVVNRTTDKAVSRLEISLLSVDHTVMTPSTQIDISPLSSRAIGETALPRSLAQTRSTAILVGTMVPVAIAIIVAGLILLTSCIAVIVRRDHRHKDYPENDHIYDYPDNHQPLALRNKLPDNQQPPVLPALRNKLQGKNIATVVESPQMVHRRKIATDDSRCSSIADADKSCAHSDSVDKSSSGTTAVAGEIEHDEACKEDSKGILLQENEAYKQFGTPLSGQSESNAAPSHDHPMECPNTDQADPFQQVSESIDPDLDAIANAEIDAPPNCDRFSLSCTTCVGIETIPLSCACGSNQLAPHNEAPALMQCTDDSRDLKLQHTIPNDAHTDSTLDAIQSEDQSLAEQLPYPYDLESGNEILAESNDSTNESTITEGASIRSCRTAYQCNSYERIWGYERIHHCDISLPEHSRPSCITQSTTPLRSVAEEEPTEPNHSERSIQNTDGYERVWGYEVIQHCDLKLEDLQ